MNPIKNYKILHLSLLLSLLFWGLISCTKTSEEGLQEGVWMRFALEASGSELVGVRGAPLDGMAERFIGDLWVIQLTDDGRAGLAAPIYIEKLEPSGILRTELVEAQSEIYFLANTGDAQLFNRTAPLTTFTRDMVSGLALEFTNGATLERTVADPVRGFAMSGLWRGTPSQGTAIMPISMHRAGAKIRLSLHAALHEGESFSPTSVQLLGVPNLMHYHRDQATLSTQISPEARGEYFDYPVAALSGELTEAARSFSWYMPENARGISTLNSSPKDKTAFYVPEGKGDYATRIEIVGEYTDAGGVYTVKYTVFPGGDSSRDYNILRNHSYNINARISGRNGIDMRIEGPEQEPVAPRSVKANCAIVAPGGRVVFDVMDRVKRCAVATPAAILPWKKGDPYTPMVIWQDTRGLIASSSYDVQNSLLEVQTQGSKGSGNALVGLFPEGTTDPASGTCIWSWHIWVTPYDPDAVASQMINYSPNTAHGEKDERGQVHIYGPAFVASNPRGVIMDRNLGATKTYYAPPSWGDLDAPKCFGFLYQWGRKDPFPGWDGVRVAGNDAATTDIIETYDNQGLKTSYPIFTPALVDVSQAIKNPHQYYTSTGVSNDWSATSYSTYWNEGTLTMPLKTAYDPCPQGWRVAVNGTWDDFHRNTSDPLNATFPYYSNGTISEDAATPGATNGRWYSRSAWYPASGCGNNGAFGVNTIINMGNTGVSASATAPQGAGAHGLHYHASDLQRGQVLIKALGYSVRCVQEPQY